MRFKVIYASKTGNTRRLAEELYRKLPGESRELVSAEKAQEGEDAELYFVGFWTNRGTCPTEIMNILGELEGKKIALFGTCGMGGAPDYYRMIRERVEACMPKTYTDCGYFMCQGRMPEQILKKYESMSGQMPEEQRQEMIRQYHMGSTHPDEKDLEELTVFLEEARRRAGL